MEWEARWRGREGESVYVPQEAELIMSIKSI